MKKQFSDRLREARRSAGITQEQLGFALDITKSSVSAWENGREMPSFKLLPQLREALGCSLDSLICGTEFQLNAVKENGTSERLNELTAKDELEAQLLIRLRKLPSKKKKALLELLK